MHTYAFVAYFDNKTETLMKNIWKDLSVKNITQYGVENKGKRPHITIADYDSLAKDVLIEMLDSYYEDKYKVDICLNIIGTFIKTGTLFIAPALSTELWSFHKEHHDYFNEFDKDKSSLYLPGSWIPHCTIASRLNEETMLEAFKYCKKNIDKLYCQISEVALIEIELNEKGIAIEDTIIFSKELK